MKQERNDFLSALYSGTTAPIRLSYQEDSEHAVTSKVEIDDLVRAAGDEPIYAFQIAGDGSVAFVYAVTHHAGPDEWRTFKQTPTVALVKGDDLITAWAFETAVTRHEATALLTAMEADPADLDEPIPTPGANGWEMVHCDPDAYYSHAALAEAYGVKAPAGPLGSQAVQTAKDTPAEEAMSVAPETFGTYADAALGAPYDEADPTYAQELVVAVGTGRDSKRWASKPMPIAQFIALLAQHPEGPKKDGPAFVLAEIAGQERRKAAVKACYGVGLDIDVGVPSARIDAALAKLGCLAIRYTTHSHGKTTTTISRDRLTKAAAKAGVGLDEAFILRFLREQEHWDEALVRSASYAGDAHEPTGLMAQIDHAPMPKHRVVLPFAEPFVLAEAAATHEEGMKLWTKVPMALARLLGDLPLDRSAVDPSRLFYFPRHAHGKPHETTLFGGPLLDWRGLELEAPVDQWEAVVAEFDTGPKGRSTTADGKALGRWSSKAAPGFQIADVIRDHAEDRIRSQGSTKMEIECPFDEEHSNPGDPEDRACVVINAGDGHSEIFTIKCQHDSCAQRTNLDMLGKMITDGWFDREVLEDEAYNAVEVDEAGATVGPGKASGADRADHLIDSLSPDAPTSAIEAVIDVIAGLNHLARERAVERMQRATKMPRALIRKEVAAVNMANAPSSRSMTKTDPATGRTVFTYQGEYDFPDACQAVLKALKDANRGSPPMPMFTCTLDDVMGLRSSHGRMRFVPLKSDALWSAACEIVSFRQMSDVGVRSLGPVPRDVATQVAHTAWNHLVQTPEIIHTPIFTARGELLREPGWHRDEANGVNIYLAETDLAVPDVPISPSDEDVVEATRCLKDELLGDFPFLDADLNGVERREPSQANAMAMIITPFVRRMIDGCTPVFFITKPTPGTGGTLLGSLPVRLFDGEVGAPMPYDPRNDEEVRKTLVAATLESRSHLFFDDVAEFNSRALIQAITARSIGGRVLGQSVNVERPNHFNWIGTGNNTNIGNEMSRRICWIRLNAKVADIQGRKFKRANLGAWVDENRAHLIWCILVLIQAWIANGKPRFEARSLASFEEWAAVVGGILENAGVEGFLDNRRLPSADSDEAGVREFIRAWHSKYGHASVARNLLVQHAIDMSLSIVEGPSEEQRKVRLRRRLDLIDGRTFPIPDDRTVTVRRLADEDGEIAFELAPTAEAHANGRG